MEPWKNLSLENMSEIVDGVLLIEEWKWLKGCKNKYQGSNFGRIKSFCRGNIIIRKQVPAKEGHLNVQLWIDDTAKTFQVHRLIGQTFIRNRRNKPEINHKKGNRKDNRIWMIEWSTASENVLHAYRELGKKNNLEWTKGEGNRLAKLTDEKVREIRALDGKMTHKEISVKYGVARPIITRVINRTRWKHVN